MPCQERRCKFIRVGSNQILRFIRIPRSECPLAFLHHRREMPEDTHLCYWTQDHEYDGLYIVICSQEFDPVATGVAWPPFDDSGFELVRGDWSKEDYVQSLEHRVAHLTQLLEEKR